MRILSTPSRIAVGGAAALAVTAAAVYVPHAAHADEAKGYTFLNVAPTKHLAFIAPDGKRVNLTPTYASLDSDGDGRPDLWSYCIEPGVPVTKRVINGQAKLYPYPVSDYSVADPARLAWVIEHGSTHETYTKLAEAAQVPPNQMTAEALERAMTDATGAAIWALSNGYKVAPDAQYAGSPAAGKAFRKAYDYLLANATPLPDKKVVILDTAPEEERTQALVIISSGDKPMPTPLPPAPKPTKTETPTPEPTKTETPTPTPTTQTPTPEPTPTETPSPAPSTETATPQPTITATDSPSPTPTPTPTQTATVLPPMPTSSPTPSPVVINSGLAAADGGPSLVGMGAGLLGLGAAATGLFAIKRRNTRS